MQCCGNTEAAAALKQWLQDWQYHPPAQRGKKTLESDEEELAWSDVSLAGLCSSAHADNGSAKDWRWSCARAQASIYSDAETVQEGQCSKARCSTPGHQSDQASGQQPATLPEPCTLLKSLRGAETDRRHLPNVWKRLHPPEAGLPIVCWAAMQCQHLTPHPQAG